MRLVGGGGSWFYRIAVHEPEESQRNSEAIDLCPGFSVAFRGAGQGKCVELSQGLRLLREL